MDFNKELFDEFVKEFVDNDAGVIRNQYPDAIFNWFRNSLFKQNENLDRQRQLELLVRAQNHLKDILTFIETEIKLEEQDLYYTKTDRLHRIKDLVNEKIGLILSP